MVNILITNRDGSAQTVEADPGQTLMEALRDAEVEGIEAICGGSCACGTCHVYVDESWLGKLRGPDESEQDLLEDMVHPQQNSRLSCQIELTEDLNGITLIVPPED